MAIHQKIKQLLQKDLWTGILYALREISLIVIGVLLAVWIDNLNEKRKDRILEIKSLKALATGLQQDAADIQSNMRGLGASIKWRDRVVSVAEGKLPLDSLPNGGSFNTSIYFLNNGAPYESLKSIGLSKISNDTLRNQIISLYELDYKIIMQNEKENNDIITTHMKDIFEKTIFLTSQREDFLSVVRKLSKEKDFKFHNNIAIQYENYQLNTQAALLPKITRLIQNLEKECAR